MRALAGVVIWVLSVVGNTPTITEYDPANFTVKRSVAVPKHAVSNSEYFSVSANGDLLFATQPNVEFGDDSNAAGRIYWYAASKAQPSFARAERDDWPRAWFLSATPGDLYVLESRHAKTLDKDGNDATVRTTTKLMRRSVDSITLTSVVDLPALPLCTCTTGVCSESCPQWQIWAPGSVIRDWFLATRYIEGQLQSDIQETWLYRNKGGWTSTKLSEPIESPLDASSDARIIIGANPDAACCGNLNESSDQLLMWRDGARTVLYDEWTRFKNDKNEDVSFEASHAHLAPSNKLLAYTISAYPPENNTSEMPLTEIVDLGQPSGRIKIPKAEMAGWLGDTELLVVQDGKLVTYDTKGVKRRETGVEAKSASLVFVRP